MVFLPLLGSPNIGSVEGPRGSAGIQSGRKTIGKGQDRMFLGRKGTVAHSIHCGLSNPFPLDSGARKMAKVAGTASVKPGLLDGFAKILIKIAAPYHFCIPPYQYNYFNQKTGKYRYDTGKYSTLPPHT